MAQRQILRDDHPLLRTPARPVKKITGGVLRLLDDMKETMDQAGGVGLAANQVGVGKRIILARHGEDKHLELINPRCLDQDGRELGVEGCLSVPGSYGEVTRYESITVLAQDRTGAPLQFVARGLLARIIQHEIDHLDGILFTDRAERMVDPETMEEGE